MSEQKPKPTVKVIPADPRFKWKKEYERQQGGVGIYCRVSTAEYAQLRSLSGQVSDMLQYVKMKNLLPKLEDIYIDIRSGTDTNRPEFDRMLADVKNGRIKTVVTRTVQRFGRNTDVVMDAIRTVRNANAHIIFVSDDLDTDRPDDAFEISIRVAMSHEDSKAKSANIKWAIRKGLQSGTSKFYNKACYGYKKDKTGKLVIDPAEAKVVRFIVAVYLEGESLIGIKRELEAKKIPSPTGKDAWSIRTIQNILRNEKYCGNVTVLKTKKDTVTSKRVKSEGGDDMYQVVNHHPAIITVQDFDEVQDEYFRRSSIEVGPDGEKRRKSTHYSSKQNTKTQK